MPMLTLVKNTGWLSNIPIAFTNDTIKVILLVGTANISIHGWPNFFPIRYLIMVIIILLKLIPYWTAYYNFHKPGWRKCVEHSLPNWSFRKLKGVYQRASNLDRLLPIEWYKTARNDTLYPSVLNMFTPVKYIWIPWPHLLVSAVCYEVNRYVAWMLPIGLMEVLIMVIIILLKLIPYWTAYFNFHKPGWRKCVEHSLPNWSFRKLKGVYQRASNLDRLLPIEWYKTARNDTLYPSVLNMFTPVKYIWIPWPHLLVSAVCYEVNRYVAWMLPIGLMEVLLEISQYTVISLNLMCSYSLVGIVFCWNIFCDKPNLSEWDNIMEEYHDIMDKYHKKSNLVKLIAA